LGKGELKANADTAAVAEGQTLERYIRSSYSGVSFAESTVPSTSDISSGHATPPVSPNIKFTLHSPTSPSVPVPEAGAPALEGAAPAPAPVESASEASALAASAPAALAVPAGSPAVALSAGSAAPRISWCDSTRASAAGGKPGLKALLRRSNSAALLTSKMSSGVRSADDVLRLARKGEIGGVVLPVSILNLIDGYELRVYWFELVECLRKFVLIVVPRLIERGSESQVSFGVLASLVFFGIYVALAPYSSQVVDGISQLCQFVIFAAILARFLLVSDTSSPDSRSALDIVLCLMAVLPVALALASSFCQTLCAKLTPERVFGRTLVATWREFGKALARRRRALAKKHMAAHEARERKIRAQATSYKTLSSQRPSPAKWLKARRILALRPQNAQTVPRPVVVPM